MAFRLSEPSDCLTAKAALSLFVGCPFLAGLRNLFDVLSTGLHRCALGSAGAEKPRLPKRNNGPAPTGPSSLVERRKKLCYGSAFASTLRSICPCGGLQPCFTSSVKQEKQPSGGVKPAGSYLHHTLVSCSFPDILRSTRYRGTPSRLTPDDWWARAAALPAAA